jgi:hypothetical protein
MTPKHEPITPVPALTLLCFDDGFNDDNPRPWAVTLNTYGPGADSVSTIATFETEEEAKAFIAECRRGLHRRQQEED